MLPDDNDADGDSITLAVSDLLANATVQLTGDILSSVFVNGSTITQDDATLSLALEDATGSSDVLNLILSADASLNATQMAGSALATGDQVAGIVSVNSVETINITADDVFVDDGSGADNNDATHTLKLSADSATLVNISGNADLDFNDVTTTSKITKIDASAMTVA